METHKKEGTASTYAQGIVVMSHRIDASYYLYLKVFSQRHRTLRDLYNGKTQDAPFQLFLNGTKFV